ncbi:GEVED domain-containing protein [Psychroserpens sp. Hel_I_66]|uniref:GEVED domain-containing protein n=1 Tax=Psychroserpens sp. Hel_I_66 TaxID=1250004 RepID=UPI00068FCDDE|nr:GEVED domain-containing protein [Psychroserpens sp. Hel_I_66]
MKKNYSLLLITFLCLVLSGYGQTIVSNSFEETAADTWTPLSFSTPPCNAGNGDQWDYDTALSSITPSNGSQFWGIQDLNGDCGPTGFATITFPSYNVSSFTGVTISFDYYIIGFDGGDDLGYEVWEDGIMVADVDNWDGNTGGWITLTHNVNNATSNVYLVLKCRQNGGSDYAAFDNVILEGTASCTPPLDPTGPITGTTPACNSTTLTYTGAALPGTVNYWQTTATGTSTANNATGTLNVTTTGTYYVRTFLTATSCWSTGAVGYGVVINTAPTISNQPNNATRVIPAAATFSVTASGTPTPTYQWQVNTGTGWNNVTGGTGATTNSYNTGATNATMHNNQYRCVVTNVCGAVNSGAATLTLTNTATSNVTAVQGCFDDDSVTLSWTAPGTGTPTGYMIFALDGGTDPAGTKTDANTYTANSDFSAATPVTPASLGRVVYKGTATTATITGLTEDNNYSFTVYSYVGETLTGWSNGGTNGSTVTNETAQGDVTNLVATPLTNQVNLNWNNPLPTSCFDQLIIVANQGPVVFTPTGTYANTDVDYSTPNGIVYSTTGTVSVNSVNGLVNGTSYCFKVFIRRGTTWTEGVEVCAVPSLTYCDSFGNTSFDTGTTGVVFNTINNLNTNTDVAYSDFTSISTTVTLGEIYNLDVRVNTDGSFNTTTMVWFDWNNDGDFSDSNEDYELGNAFNVANGSTDGSPLAIEIPTNAVIASTRMRVSTIYNLTPTTPCQTGFDGEVEDYTINIVQPVNGEMNIKGNNISIANGFNAPYGLNNTLFGSTNVGSPGPVKTFSVENIGATVLNLTGTPRVEIIGANAGDFIVTIQPAASVTYGTPTTFNIQFFPSADGTRTATVRIANTDSNENPYEFDIQGTAVCSTVLTSNIWPVEGPENTEVNITSVNDLTGATATINGISMTVVSTSSTELVVLIPAGATNGNLEVLFSTGCSSTNAFTIIDNAIGGCETATSSIVPGNLFISEISDAHTGSSSLIEVFNGTTNTINLTNYSIRIFNNGSASPSFTANLTGSLAPGGVHVISVGTTSCNTYANGLNGSLPNQSFDGAGGINFDNNSSDAIQLFNGSSAIDSFGVVSSGDVTVADAASWANGLVIDGDGVNFRRQNTATPLPSTTFDITQWDQVDWSTCGDSDYSDFGIYDFSLGVPPTVSVLADPTFNCTGSTFLSITGTEGVPSGFGLVYQWYYLAPNDTNFVVVPNSADFNGENSATLEVVNNLAYNNYQFYCQVRENNATCYTASNAVKLSAEGAVWDGTSWSSSPSDSKIVIINADYDTNNGTNGQDSFQACQLIVNSGARLTVHNGDFVEVINDVVVNGNTALDYGEIIVNTHGAFIQRGNSTAAGTFTLNGTGNSQVVKFTAPLQNWYDYTYWSSPVVNARVTDALFTSDPNRRFWYNANNYLDSDGDDIDDNDNDWTLVTGASDPNDIMTSGKGYAATHDNIAFMPNQAYQYIFEGALQTGDVSYPLAYNSANSNHWNLVGNPYPSAIDVDDLFALNTAIKDVVYLWSHYRAPLDTNPGNEVLNFSQNDYLLINDAMEVGNGSDLDGDGDVDALDIPERYIPSGQSFFISSLSTNPILFNNSMRISGENSNNQFFRVAQSNKIWINLTSNSGAYSQTGIAYLNTATNGFDGIGYDAKRNTSVDVAASIYTLITETPNTKYAIQAKAEDALSLNEVIPLGFATQLTLPSIYEIKLLKKTGDFMNENTVYLKDYLMNITHVLSENAYAFTSETGEFNDRFEIVFQPETLSVSENEISPNDLSIIELSDGNVKISVGKNMTIKSVEIMDMLGRTIYNLKGQNSTEIYDLSTLSQSTYVARVTLSNDQVVSKKAVKMK